MQQHYDVIVIGGGAAGVGAAISSAETGAKTLLVESGPCLGGAATQKGVLTYCGLFTQEDRSRVAVSGVATRVLNALKELGGLEGPFRLPAPSGHVIVIFDPEALKVALDRIVSGARLDLLLHTRLIAVQRSRDRLINVTLQDDGGPKVYEADCFIDASGDGALAAFGGASVRYGNHDKAQAGTLSVRIGGIAEHADRSAQCWAKAIADAKKGGMAMLDKEHGLVLTLPISGDVVTYYIDASYNALDASSLTAAEILGREKALAYLDAIRRLPGYERAYIVSTGPNFGTRESRHINGRYQISESDVLSGMRHEDVVALGAWPVEYHPSGGGPTAWKDVKDKGTFDVPLRCLMSTDTANLFSAGRLADGDGGAGGAIRVMGTSFATGQAAGVAAALSAGGSMNIEAIQRELKRQGASLNAGDLPPTDLQTL